MLQTVGMIQQLGMWSIAGSALFSLVSVCLFVLFLNAEGKKEEWNEAGSCRETVTQRCYPIWSLAQQDHRPQLLDTAVLQADSG